MANLFDYKCPIEDEFNKTIYSDEQKDVEQVIADEQIKRNKEENDFYAPSFSLFTFSDVIECLHIITYRLGKHVTLLDVSLEDDVYRFMVLLPNDPIVKIYRFYRDNVGIIASKSF